MSDVDKKITQYAEQIVEYIDETTYKDWVELREVGGNDYFQYIEDLLIDIHSEGSF